MGVFEEWKVLPHRPVEKLHDNLWTVAGDMPGGFVRRMVVARLRDGRLVIHNPIALDEGEMQELEAFGEIDTLVSPNAFHRQDIKIWKDRYPKARVVCPAAAIKKVSKVTQVEGDLSLVPRDDTVSMDDLQGTKQREGVLKVLSPEGTTLVFNDLLLNMAPMSGAKGFMLGPTGRPSLPRAMRWLFVSDKREFGKQLVELADSDRVLRLVPGHGELVTEAASEQLQRLAQEFCA